MSFVHEELWRVDVYLINFHRAVVFIIIIFILTRTCQTRDTVFQAHDLVVQIGSIFLLDKIVRIAWVR